VRTQAWQNLAIRVSEHFESPWDDAQTLAVISTALKISETYAAPFPIRCLHCFQTGIDLAPSAQGGERLVPLGLLCPPHQETHAGRGFPLLPVPPAKVRAHGQKGDKP